MAQIKRSSGEAGSAATSIKMLAAPRSLNHMHQTSYISIETVPSMLAHLVVIL
jgi:hypothetical protein